jgi:hypothetical protein
VGLEAASASAGYLAVPLPTTGCRFPCARASADADTAGV